ncbi:hypothetical protein [Anaerospora hongkongensis]|uniref:hypothetical protein n=1 Tax=Anaerospora hongkongensis TaxID=244830 RepID=UPI002898B25F|nr:hypothetical protein [Anaerospora hongkongensis]
MSASSKNELLNCIMVHLPDVSTSLSKLVADFQNIIQESEDDEDIEIIAKRVIAELHRLLSTLKESTLLIRSKVDNFDNDDKILILNYLDIFSEITSGVSLMLSWKDSDDSEDSEEKLIEAVNKLFRTGQQLVSFVDELTNE